jgi:hypothetical protein
VTQPFASLDAVRSRLVADGAPRADELGARVRPCLLLATLPTSSGFTHLGGLPSLPEGRAWPCSSLGDPLVFLGQLDLAALAGTRVASELPPRGLLGWYFSDLDGRGPPELAIIHVEGPVFRRDAPPHACVLAERGVRLLPSWSLPPKDSPAIAEMGLSDAEREAWGELVAAWDCDVLPRGHQLLGYDHGSDAYLHSAIDTDEALREAYFERYRADPRGTIARPFDDAALAARARAFRLLVTFADDPDLGIVWGDGAPTSLLVHEDAWSRLDLTAPTPLAIARCDRS